MGLPQLFLVFLLVFLYHVSCVAAQTSGPDYFITPPGKGTNDTWADNPVYNNGDILQMEWSTDIQSLYLLLWQWQNNINEKSVALLEGAGPSSSFRWEVSLTYANTTFDLATTSDGVGNVFFMTMYNGSFENPVFLCHTFNISDKSLSNAISTTSTQTPASSTTISTSNTIPTVPLTTPSSSPSPSPAANPAAPSSGLTAGQQAGIGVGVGIVGLIALAALVVPLLLRRSRRAPSEQHVGILKDDKGSSNNAANVYSDQETKELANNERTAELSGRQSRGELLG